MQNSKNGTLTSEMAGLPLGQHLTESIAVHWLEFDRLVRQLRRRAKARRVHDVRVVNRRLIAVLDLVRETVPVPTATELRKPLEKQLKTLGDLRDAQVHLSLVKGMVEVFPSLESFHQQLKGRMGRLRRTACRRMRQVHLKRLQQQKDQLVAEVEPHWSALLSERQLSQTIEAIDRAFSAVIEARARLDMTNLDTVHKMRLPFKKFRYMVEAVQPYLLGMGRAQLTSMHAFQSMMGDIHDLDVLARHLAHFQAKAAHPARLGPAQDELTRRLLLSTNSFMAASDEIYSFWDHAWFPDHRKS